MSLVLTGSLTGQFVASVTSTTYVTLPGETIATSSSAVAFLGGDFLTYVLGGAIYSDRNGLTQGPTDATSNNTYVVEETGTIFAGIAAMNLNASDSFVSVRGSVYGSRSALQLTGDDFDVSVSGRVESNEDGILLIGGRLQLGSV